MKYETSTFTLRDNEMMMRELSSAETNDVVGGVGLAAFMEAIASGSSSSLSVDGNFTMATTNTSASVSLAESIAATGVNNALIIQVATQVA